ncbi:MAG: phosphohydrolase [Bacteroidia bacterium]|nr:phosphohydrolase [Bacteroidia bacterium]
MDVAGANQFILEKLKRELSPKLYYHSVEHVLDVHEQAMAMAQKEKLSSYEKNLLSTAVYYHDSGFLFQTNGHEERSCEIAGGILPQFGFTETDILQIQDLIRATRIPQTPKNLLEEIICDADLDYLGRDDFFDIGQLLFRELCDLGVLKTEEQWNKLQVQFLENHHYFTHYAKTFREKKKESHLNTIKSLVKTH